MHELLARAGGGDVEPFHCLDRGRVFVVVVHDEQSGQLRRLPQELQAVLEGLSGKQNQRFHLSGVLTRYFDGMEDAEPPGSSHTDDITLDAWLRNQVLKRCVNVARPHRAYLCPLRVQQLGIRRAAFAKSAQIERKRVDSSRRELPGYGVPRVTCPVALVQQQHTRARLGRGKIAGLQDGSVSRLQVNHTWSRLLRLLRLIPP